MTDGDKLILNISSGTPGMKGALLVLGSLGEIECQCVRVDLNKNIIELPWPGRSLLHEEIAKKLANSPEKSDRTKTEVLENLIYITQRRQIAEFVRSYDYDAAYSMAKGLKRVLTAQYLDLLEAAKNRSHLMLGNVRRYESKFSAKILPFDGQKSNLFEYALECDLKLKRGELADFIRSLSPLIFDLFRLICEANTPVTEPFLAKFTFKSKRNGALCWDRAKLESEASNGNQTASDVFNVFRRNYRNGPWTQEFRLSKPILIQSDNFCRLIEGLCCDPSLRADVCRMREIENTVRNCAAHQMISVSEDLIRKMTCGKDQKEPMTSGDIMRLVKRLFSYRPCEIAPEAPEWNSYDAMNDAIAARLGE